MNDNYQKYMDVTANECTRKNSKFYFDALDKYNIDVSSDNISSLEQLENIFVQLGFNSLNPDLHTGHKTAAIMHSKPMKNIKMTFTIFQNARFK